MNLSRTTPGAKLRLPSPPTPLPEGEGSRVSDGVRGQGLLDFVADDPIDLFELALGGHDFGQEIAQTAG